MILEVSYLCPFKAYKSTSTPGKHFDDDWFVNQIKSFEKPVKYYGKWQKSDTAVIQCISSIQPTVRLYKCDRTVEPTSPVSLSLIATDPLLNVGLYHGNVNFTNVAEGIYWPVIEATLLDVTLRVICEPIQVKTAHRNTMLFTYKNSINDFGVVFSGTVTDTAEPYLPQFTFRAEAGIMDYTPERERAAYRDQVLNTTTLSATPSRQFKLYIGEAPGVAPWVVDILNRIFCCDYVLIEDKQYETPEGSKWEVSRAKGYPMIGASIDLVEAQNRSSLQQSSDVIPGGGILVGYNIETDMFGTMNAPSSTNPQTIETIEE